MSKLVFAKMTESATLSHATALHIRDTATPAIRVVYKQRLSFASEVKNSWNTVDLQCQG